MHCPLQINCDLKFSGCNSASNVCMGMAVAQYSAINNNDPEQVKSETEHGHVCLKHGTWQDSWYICNTVSRRGSVCVLFGHNITEAGLAWCVGACAELAHTYALSRLSIQPSPFPQLFYRILDDFCKVNNCYDGTSCARDSKVCAGGEALAARGLIPASAHARGFEKMSTSRQVASWKGTSYSMKQRPSCYSLHTGSPDRLCATNGGGL